MKSKQLATLLAFTLGGLGIHRFYLKQPKLAWWYLAFCWTLVPLLIALIDGIAFATMSYATFNRKYTLRHVFKKVFTDDEALLEFNTNEKLEKELLAKLEELGNRENVENFLKASKENGVYLPRKVYVRAKELVSGDSHIYRKTLDIH